jgi:hypothetical protein
MAGAAPSLTAIFVAVIFMVPGGSEPRKLINIPQKKMGINCFMPVEFFEGYLIKKGDTPAAS